MCCLSMSNEICLIGLQMPREINSTKNVSSFSEHSAIWAEEKKKPIFDKGVSEAKPVLVCSCWY